MATEQEPVPWLQTVAEILGTHGLVISKLSSCQGCEFPACPVPDAPALEGFTAPLCLQSYLCVGDERFLLAASLSEMQGC